VTNTPQFTLEYYDPPKALERYVLTTFHFTCAEPEHLSRQPGASGQLVLMPDGSGEADLGDRVAPFEGPAFLFSGFSVAVPFLMKGPWHVMGASLSPSGWAALTGVSASDHIDDVHPAKGMLGLEFDAFAVDVNARYRSGELSGRQGCDALCDWIAANLKTISSSHAALIDQTLEWLGGSLNPDLDDLFRHMSYSRRQTERLVERYFGVPPAALARKYRAVRASALLAQPELPSAVRAKIDAAFHDAPHMIKEIRRYSGHTPARLGGEADPILQTLLQMKNFDRLKLFKGVD